MTSATLTRPPSTPLARLLAPTVAPAFAAALDAGVRIGRVVELADLGTSSTAALGRSLSGIVANRQGAAVRRWQQAHARLVSLRNSQIVLKPTINHVVNAYAAGLTFPEIAAALGINARTSYDPDAEWRAALERWGIDLDELTAKTEPVDARRKDSETALLQALAEVVLAEQAWDEAAAAEAQQAQRDALAATEERLAELEQTVVEQVAQMVANDTKRFELNAVIHKAEMARGKLSNELRTLEGTIGRNQHDVVTLRAKRDDLRAVLGEAVYLEAEPEPIEHSGGDDDDSK